MEELEIKNAKITNISVSMEDHGCLTFYITLDGGAWGCTYGGYCMGKGYLGAKEFYSTDAGLEILMRIMDTVGVEKWEDLKGKYCRVKTEGWGGTIQAIGNILTNKWFDIEEFYSNYNNTHSFDDNEALDEKDLEKVIDDYCTLQIWADRYYRDKYEDSPKDMFISSLGVTYISINGNKVIISLKELADYIKKTKKKRGKI
jgi:hypothetical protein